jgi:O-acetyl-ADP-ribose deacetylase (regulator of RNase III)
MGGGVSNTLALAAGDSLRAEARKHIPLKLGDVAVTSAGKLKAKYVFHAITIDRDRSMAANEENLRAATTRCLVLADALFVHSIALPALGAGVARVPVRVAADVMTTTICDYLRRQTGLERVILALYAQGGRSSESDFDVFYERAAALSAINSQSRALANLLGELRSTLQQQRPDLIDHVRRLESELADAQHAVTDHATAEDLRALSDVGRQAAQFAVDSNEIAQWNDRQLDSQVVQTRIAGLLTQQNVIVGNLNQLEIQQANYGGQMVPLILVNSIAEQRRNYDDIDHQVKSMRMRLATLIGL